MARLGRAQPNKPIIVRGTLVDEPDVRGNKPVISSRTDRKFFRTKAAIVTQNAQQQAAAVAGTQKPLVVSASSTRYRKINKASIVRADTTFATEAIATPVVVTSPVARRRMSPAIIVTGSEDDTPPVVTDVRPQPLVVTPRLSRRNPNVTVIIRTPAEGAPVPPPGPGPDPDFCVYAPFVDWGAGQPFTDWAASAPITDWFAEISEEC